MSKSGSQRVKDYRIGKAHVDFYVSPETKKRFIELAKRHVLSQSELLENFSGQIECRCRVKCLCWSTPDMEIRRPPALNKNIQNLQKNASRSSVTYGDYV
jgi:hypothetical protein